MNNDVYLGLEICKFTRQWALLSDGGCYFLWEHMLQKASFFKVTQDTPWLTTTNCVLTWTFFPTCHFYDTWFWALARAVEMDGPKIIGLLNPLNKAQAQVIPTGIEIIQFYARKYCTSVI